MDAAIESGLLPTKPPCPILRSLPTEKLTKNNQMKRINIMRNLLSASLLSAVLALALAPAGARAAFTIGDLAVEDLYTNGTSSTFEIVELNPYATNTAPVYSVQIPFTGASALRQSSSASSGRLALSQDRTLLAFTAAEDATGTSDETTVTNRGVGTLDANGDYVLQASYKGLGGSTKDQARSATSLDDITWYFGDKGGIYTNNTGTTPLNGTNVRPLKSFGGAIYALQDGSGSVVQQVTSGGTVLTSLPGLATDANALDFYMFASGNNGPTNDTIYTDDGTNINKYALVSGSWTSEGTIPNCGYTADGLCALNIGVAGTNAYIFITTGTSGKVVQLTDTNAYNQTIGINTNNDVVIFAPPQVAGSTNYLKGIDFAPTPKLYAEQLPNATANDQQFSLVELNPYLTNAIPVNTVVIPTNGPSALRQISSGSSGRLSLTGDRTLLAFTGYNDPNGEPGSTSEADFNLRGVGTIDSTLGGDYTLQATYTGIGGSTANQTRTATSLNNSLWYIGDKGGVYTNNTTSPLNTTNVRPIKVFGGTLYVCSPTSSSANPAILNTLSLDGTTLTPLPGLGTTLDANATDFYMIQSGANGTNYDIAYVADTTVITKYCLVSGSWTSLGAASLGVTADGICALNIGGGAQLYVTTGTPGQVVEIMDTTGWNEAPVINSANNVVLYTGAAYLKGIEFAPVGGIVTSTLNQPPTVSPDPHATVDHNFTNTYAVNATWQAAITNITVNGSVLSPTAYNTNTAGEIIFTPSASPLLQSAGTLSIVYYATNFNPEVVAQPIAPGAPKSFSIIAQPVAPTGNGGTLVEQPAAAVVDQYGNPVTNTDTVTASPSGSWSFGLGSGTTQPLVNGTATFTNLNAFSSAAVPAATISFTVSGSGLGGLPYTTTNSSAFSIPAPLPGGFTPGYLVVEQLDQGSANNSTFSILELNPGVSNSVPVKIFPVPATYTNGLRQSSSASTGDLADSDDGTLLCFSAALCSDSTVGDVTTLNNRGAGTFNFTGTYNLAATYGGYGDLSDQARSAVTIDDTTFFMGDKGGIYTNGENTNTAYIPYVSSSSSSANVRSLKSFGGTIYVMQQEGGTDPSSPVMNLLPLPGSTATYLVSLVGPLPDGNVLDFYALRSGNNGGDYDTIYYIDETNGAAGSLWKWFYTGTSNLDEQEVWNNAGGTMTSNWLLPTNAGDGLCAVTNINGGVDLYYTTGSGSATGNSVVHAYDSAAWNLPINITSSSVIYTAPAGVALKGIAFAPLPGPGNVPIVPVGNIGSTNGVLAISYALSGANAGLTFSFTNAPGYATSYSVWSTTNLLVPFSQWIYVGHPTEAPAGTYSITDPAATNNPATFYRVTSP